MRYHYRILFDRWPEQGHRLMTVYCRLIFSAGEAKGKLKHFKYDGLILSEAATVRLVPFISNQQSGKGAA